MLADRSEGISPDQGHLHLLKAQMLVKSKIAQEGNVAIDDAS
jgi:hypothetical protein